MTLRTIQVTAFLFLASCGASGPAAQPADGNGATASAEPASSSARPFSVSEIATFDRPWAIAFLPGSATALVTEKPGELWLVDVANGQKTKVAGAPQVTFGGQGGLLDVAVAPDFAASSEVYLTYSRPSDKGGSSLALARGTLARSNGTARLDGLHVIWNDPEGGEGGQFGGRIAFAPDGQSLFLSSGERQRFTPAQDPNQPLGKILHLTLDGEAGAGKSDGGQDRRGQRHGHRSSRGHAAGEIG